jgi:hypothetical protein
MVNKDSPTSDNDHLHYLGFPPDYYHQHHTTIFCKIKEDKNKLRSDIYIDDAGFLSANAVGRVHRKLFGPWQLWCVRNYELEEGFIP